MALSGSFSKDYVGDYFGLKVDWSGTQDVSTNSTTITLRVYLHVRDIQVGSRSDNTVKVNGVTYKYDTQSLDEPAGTHYTLLATIPNIVVPHNADGTKTVSMSVSWKANLTYSGNWIGEMTVSQSVTLDRIARASTMTVPSTMKMDTAHTFNITRQDNSFTHALSYKFINQTGNISVSGTTATWTPLSEDLAGQITNSVSGTLTLTLVTYSGTTEIGRNVYNTILYVPDNMKPTATINSVSIVNTNGTVAGWGIALQGYSQIGWSVSGEGASDSTITGYEITIDGKTYTSATGTSYKLDGTSGKVSVRVQDSRGRWSNTAEDISINVTPYSTPSISNSVVRRCDVNGEEKTNGTYLRVLCMAAFSSIMVGGVEKNPVNIKAKWKPASGSWGAEVSIANGQPEILGQGNIAVTSSYEVLISVSDNLSDGIPILHTIPVGAVAMNIKDGGTGAAFGKYAEHDKALELPGDWNIRFGDKTLLELVYPVGSIYMSVSSVGPAGLFGGEWTRITNRFLLAAGDMYSAGDTGGEASHTLAVDEMPSHDHGGTATTSENGAHTHQYGYGQNSGSRAADGAIWNTAGNSNSASEPDAGKNTTQDGAHTHTVTIDSAGGGLAHNNMPPYLVVYVWKRTA